MIKKAAGGGGQGDIRAYLLKMFNEKRDPDDDDIAVLAGVLSDALEGSDDDEPAAEPEPAPSSDDELFQPAEEEDKDAQIAALQQQIRTLKLKEKDKTIYEEGYNEGYDEGYGEGYNEAAAEGYEEGYEEAAAAAEGAEPESAVVVKAEPVAEDIGATFEEFKDFLHTKAKKKAESNLGKKKQAVAPASILKRNGNKC